MITTAQNKDYLVELLTDMRNAKTYDEAMTTLSKAKATRDKIHKKEKRGSTLYKETSDLYKSIEKAYRSRFKTREQLMKEAELTTLERDAIEGKLNSISENFNIAEIVGDRDALCHYNNACWDLIDEIDRIKECREASFVIKEQRQQFSKEVEEVRQAVLYVQGEITNAIDLEDQIWEY